MKKGQAQHDDCKAMMDKHHGKDGKSMGPDKPDGKAMADGKDCPGMKP